MSRNKEDIKKIIEALEIITNWYECNTPLKREELNHILFELKK